MLNLTHMIPKRMISWTVRVYSYGPTVRVWSDRTSIRIRSGPYAYGPNTHMVWNIYNINFTNLSALRGKKG